MTKQDRLLQEKTIRCRLRDISKRQEELAKEIKKLESDRHKLMERCEHDLSYCPDPSGNNDSYYVCDICGKESR